MNYKLATTGLILCIVYLVAFYILKFFYPDILLQAVTTPELVRLGELLSSSFIGEYIVGTITSFVTYYLFASACSGRFSKSAVEWISIVLAIVISWVVLKLLPELYVHTTTSLMFLLGWICKGKLMNATITFVLHGYLSQFLTAIKGFETIIIYMNALSGLLFSLEAFVWLLLLSIIFYIKEGNYEHLCSTIYQ